jgi:hypothetical protein
MKKNRIIFGALLGLALVLGILVISCPEDTWGAEPPVLTRLGITSGGRTVNVSSFGTPNVDPAQAVAGSVTLRTNALDDEGIPILSVPDPVITFQPDTVELQWAVTKSQILPEDYSDDAIENLSNGDFLWIQVTEGGVSNYYVIRIAVEYREVDAFDIDSHPASRQLSLADWNAADASIKKLNVTMVKDATGYQYQWYSNTALSNSGGQPISEATTTSYTPEITAVGDYYYYVIVTLDELTVTSNVAWIKIIDGALEPAPTEFEIGTTRLNYIRGVGGTGSFMFRTGSNADASPDADVNYIDLLMGTLGANVLRIMVQDDYLNYIQNTVQSPSNQAQFFHNAQKNFFPVIRRVNEAGGYVFANPWTAPLRSPNDPNYLMKTTSQGGNTPKETPDGGYLRTTGLAYVDYADHFRNFLTWLNENNAPIFALGILNEPDYGGSAAYEGMGVTGDVVRSWFRVVGHFPTQKADRSTASNNARGTLIQDIIPGYGGGGPTHHVLAQTPDPMGLPGLQSFVTPSINDSGPNGANNVIEIIGRHYYQAPDRYTIIAGTNSHSATATNMTPWFDRPQPGQYTGPYESESLAMSPQMYAPGSQAGSIKREVWQTEHDFNFNSQSVVAGGTPHKYWNSAFALMNDIDWCFRMAGESVFDWWFSSSYSGMVTSYHSVTGNEKSGATPNPDRYWGPYTITPRGRAFAHYGRYVNETWLLPITRTKGTQAFNNTGAFDAGSKVPKISAFEDVNGKFISIVMFTPNNSTNTTNPNTAANSGAIGNGFGSGGLNGSDLPTTGVNVGKIAVVMPPDFTANGATALRSYGDKVSTGETWDTEPIGSPRYWIDEPVFLSRNSEGMSVVEVTLPPGTIISIKVTGNWSAGGRYFEERPRPYDRYQSGQMTGPIMTEGASPPDR